ncbi:MAG: flavodoxin family protein [Anaerolineae bacterium]|nr:flavodoxin family protein [Anaerolineae bacterium]
MKQRKIVVVLGSPRRKGNSASLAEQVIAGAEAAGAEVVSFYLHGMTLYPCAACDSCRRGAWRCVQEDDMHLIYPVLREADALVIATPVYWFTMSAQTKIFLDRCYGLGGPERHALRGIDVGLVLAYGDSDPFNSGAVNALRAFQDAFGYLEAPIVGMVYGSADKPGEIRANTTLMEAAYQLGQTLAQRA